MTNQGEGFPSPERFNVLISANDLGVYLGIDSTSLDGIALNRLTLAPDIGQGIFERFIGYKIEGEEETVVLDGDGSSTLWLPYFPVNEITKIQYYDEVTSGWLEIPLEYIRCNSNSGEVSLSFMYSANQAGLLQSTFPEGFQNIKVSFKFGYESGIDIGDVRYSDFRSIKFAILEIAALVFRHAGDLSFNSIDDGVQKSRYDFSGATFMYMLSPEVVNIIHTFAKRSAAR